LKVEPQAGINQLLHRLSKPARQRILERMMTVDLARGQVLYEARSEIEYSFFPLESVLSALVVMSDGSMIEVATVGNEGAVGVPAARKSESSPHRVLTQIPGSALRIERALLEKELNQANSTTELFVAYNTAFMFQVSQSVACNGLHQVQQRCARWLLMTHDRVSGDSFNLTHEFLAAMIGVRRATVSEVLQALEDEKVIDNARATITISDRGGLERKSCECYQAVIDEYRRLLG
jgi:CRP-like cAMP-binding protein